MLWKLSEIRYCLVKYAPTPDPSPSGGGACLSGVCAAHFVRRTHTKKSSPPFPKGRGDTGGMGTKMLWFVGR